MPSMELWWASWRWGGLNAVEGKFNIFNGDEDHLYCKWVIFCMSNNMMRIANQQRREWWYFKRKDPWKSYIKLSNVIKERQNKQCCNKKQWMIFMKKVQREYLRYNHFKMINNHSLCFTVYFFRWKSYSFFFLFIILCLVVV